MGLREIIYLEKTEVSSTVKESQARKMSEIYQDDMVLKKTTRTSNYKDCPSVDIANIMTESRIIT